MMPVTIDTTMVYVIARRSTAQWMKYGMSSRGIALSSQRRPTTASTMPIGAAMSPSRMASVTSWRTMRQRPAPSAARIEISAAAPTRAR